MNIHSSFKDTILDVAAWASLKLSSVGRGRYGFYGPKQEGQYGFTYELKKRDKQEEPGEEESRLKKHVIALAVSGGEKPSVAILGPLETSPFP